MFCVALQALVLVHIKMSDCSGLWTQDGHCTCNGGYIMDNWGNGECQYYFFRIINKAFNLDKKNGLSVRTVYMDGAVIV